MIAKTKSFTLLSLLFLTICISSCMDSPEVDDPNKRLADEIRTIDNYLIANNSLFIVKDVSGVRMAIEELGKNLPAMSNSTVKVDYVGKLFSDGTTFDQGTIDGPLSSYIDGWKIAMSTLPAGTKARLYIPSAFGYGARSLAQIPANSILVFDIYFKEVTESAGQKSRFTTDTTAIDDYLALKGITSFVKDTTGIRYVITEPGSGSIPYWYNGVKIKFTIKLLPDDTRIVATVEREPIDEFYSRPIDFFHGLNIILQKMKAGSKATVYVPSGRAFSTLGARDGAGVTVVPPNANIIVDVELIQVF